MNKLDIIKEIEQSEMTERLRQALLKEIDQYPDELSEEDRIKIIRLLRAVQVEELAGADDLNEVANQLDLLVDSLDKSEDEFVIKHLRSMKNTLDDIELVMN